MNLKAMRSTCNVEHRMKGKSQKEQSRQVGRDLGFSFSSPGCGLVISFENFSVFEPSEILSEYQNNKYGCIFSRLKVHVLKKTSLFRSQSCCVA